MKETFLNDVISLHDYDPDGIPDSVKNLKPVIYKEGRGYCCLLGEDPQLGIFGCGATPEEAMKNWDEAYMYLITKDPELKSIYYNGKDYTDHWVGWKENHLQ